MRLPGVANLPIGRPLARRLALALAGTRVLVGLTALAAPGAMGKVWVGEDATRPGSRLLGRAMGGRDLALGLGALLAARHDVALRGWVEAGALADVTDAGLTALTFGTLPRRTRPLVLAATFGAVVAGGLLAPLVDEARS